MNKQEIKDLLKDVVVNFIKDDPEAAKTSFHGALGAKMRDRVNPPEDESVVDQATHDGSED